MEIHAPDNWRCIEFISDLHLHASEPQTFTAWQHYLETSQADAIFILGDLFEVWVGDDVLEQATSFETTCVQHLRARAKRCPVYVMHGNRDFLLGSKFANAAGITLINDPCALSVGDQRIVLSHGDAMCLDDHAYMQFRVSVRSKAWQQDFLAQPLQTRIDLANRMRRQSEALKHAGTVYADVDTQAALECLSHADASVLVHGHTHKPDTHPLGKQHQRIVLSDWDLSATPPRAEVLRLQLPPSDIGSPPNFERLRVSL